MKKKVVNSKIKSKSVSTKKVSAKSANIKKSIPKKVNEKKDISTSIKWIYRLIGILAFTIAVTFISIYTYEKYVINQTCFNFYLEVKDRDYKQKILTNDEIQECIDSVCLNYDTGYTIWKGVGGYIGDDKLMHSDETFIIRINNINTDIANKIASDFVSAVNSTACMIEENRSKAWIYSRN